MYLIHYYKEDFQEGVLTVLYKFASSNKEEVFKEVMESKRIVKKILKYAPYYCQDRELSPLEEETIFRNQYKEYKSFFEEIEDWGNGNLYFVGNVEDLLK